MIPVAITQRVSAMDYGERRDSLDQRWAALLGAAGLCPCAMPNDAPSAAALFAAVKPAGLLLTGGNSLTAYGGGAPERDSCEARLLAIAYEQGLPVLGICRGMQVLLAESGGSFVAVSNHVMPRQDVILDTGSRTVNSYHDWGCYEVPAEWQVFGRSEDGVVKAIRHRRRPVIGIMWHPERIGPFAADDVELLRLHFGKGS
jgi:putative glutamine amidotransferase